MSQPHSLPEYLVRDVLHPDDYALAWPVVERIPPALRQELLAQRPSDPRLKSAYAGSLALSLTRLLQTLPDPLPPSLAELYAWAESRSALKLYDEFTSSVAELVYRIRSTDERYGYWGVSAYTMSAIGRTLREQSQADSLKDLAAAAAMAAEAARRTAEATEDMIDEAQRAHRRTARWAVFGGVLALACAVAVGFLAFQLWYPHFHKRPARAKKRAKAAWVMPCDSSVMFAYSAFRPGGPDGREPSRAVTVPVSFARAT